MRMRNSFNEVILGFNGDFYIFLFPNFLSDSAFLNGQPLVRLSAPVRFDILPFSVPNIRLVVYQRRMSWRVQRYYTDHQQPIAAKAPEPNWLKANPI